MKIWIPTAAAITAAAVAVTAVNAGSCSPESPRNCLNYPAVVNFNSVPAISEQIVNEEKINQKPQNFTIDPPAATPYTGPTFGKSLGRQVPTVGYQWSLD
jgi:hypothetical protein